MKNAILLHGSSCTPDSYWLPNIKRFLERKGYRVWVPQLPQPDAPNLKLQLPFVMHNTAFNEHTIIVAHSAGVPLTLSILEKLRVRIAKAVLVAGFARRVGNPDDDEYDAILQRQYDWERIRNAANEIVIINSDNDRGAAQTRKVSTSLTTPAASSSCRTVKDTWVRTRTISRTRNSLCLRSCSTNVSRHQG